MVLAARTARTRAAQAAATAKPAAASAVADLGILRSATAGILGLRAQATTDEADARAEELSATGYQREADAYGTVSGIAEENAGIAGIAGDIKALQMARSVTRTVGSQKAAVAAAGFGAAGSNLDILRASMQEGYFADQMIRTQTSLTQGGYLQEGAAAQAQAGGAMMASESALNLAKTRRAAGSLATANAASHTAALQAYIKETQGGAELTPAQRLVLGTLDGDTGAASGFSSEALGLTRTAGAGVTADINSPAQRMSVQERQARQTAASIDAGGAPPIWTGVGPGVDYTYLKYLTKK